ncbi:MAG TPA: class I SAM-dependent methyltransferase [Parvibaculum sp.]|jgi:SAM-dependent methyltransferase
MTQNIYDNEDFFAGYGALPRSVDGLAGAPEWPSLRALLPDVTGLDVVDLGCGFGWFCRWARERGADTVQGFDVSEKMLARAREMTSDAAISYERADLETLDLSSGAFDLVYSSLAFHYIEKLERLFSVIAHALRPGGRFVFSVEHPMLTAPRRPRWIGDGDEGRVWPLDNYLVEGPRETDWLTKGVIKQHRTIGTYINMLIACGFTLSHIEEWGPTDAELAARPDLAAERQRPTFLLVSASLQN